MRILVTGASSGIGRQLARDYLEQGYQVTCCGRNQQALSELVSAFPQTAETLVFDMTDREQTAAAIGAAGPFELAILNAGTCEYIDATDFDAALFERVVKTNLIGLANCIAPLISRIRPRGRIALMGSSASYLPLPRAEAYGASKAGVEYLASTLAITLESMDVGVSYIAPGFVDTPLTRRNHFRMPGIVDPVEASRQIRDGLARGKREIHFPRKFTLMLKFISALPQIVQDYLIKRTVLAA